MGTYPSASGRGNLLNSSASIHPTHERVRAIKTAPSPTNNIELSLFFGLINYYGKFLPQLSTVFTPLYTPLKKGTGWSQKSQQANTFNKAKLLLQEALVFMHFDSSREIFLECDASPYGVGSVFSHRMDDGSERPIG